MELKIEYVPIDTLKPYENNAKVHTAEQIEQIKKSIEDYGMNDAIGVWHDTIVEGHGRYTACLELGYTEVPITRLDHLTDEQRREYMLVHNQTTMNTGYDMDLLSLELDELENFDASAFGFDEIEEIVDGILEPEEKPEVEFAEVLNEQNNYIVLKFNNEVDWLQAQSVFDIKPVKCYSTRNDGKITEKMQRIGQGRVLDGAKAIRDIMGENV